MNWDAIGAIGEVAGAIAVVATLFYLAGQMRQNSNMLQAQAKRQVLEGMSTDAERFVSLDAFGLTVNPGKKELTPVERARQSVLLLSFMGNLEMQFQGLRDGSLDDEFAETLRYRLYTCLANDNGPELWEANRYFFTKSFQDYVDGQIAGGLVEDFADRPAGHMIT